mmetsp:Transcript_118317/g.264558  ORF Transcript_118317/g.264558 Transcript_118317/m.264558 type:complete len:110 (+) Transcript_118317:70-399(+)|eukprot:CAMPEP_0180564322 /NCGR_PEP_ID=MMETSP1037_2-20121125/4949_1 /TAXON_ID=632150 /ORGANISM="Azadinium spinosum, Strain 3D9" /LENGTH=109 /DNA_ID=CAMNT_0022581215 /DNA_START=52 /DNA_END=381 /DNA_ORIENTATION=-
MGLGQVWNELGGQPAAKYICLGWLCNAFAWISVNTLLFLINWDTTDLQPPWFLYPLLCWGFGVAMHGIVVFYLIRSMGLAEDVKIFAADIKRLLQGHRPAAHAEPLLAT